MCELNSKKNRGEKFVRFCVEEIEKISRHYITNSTHLIPLLTHSILILILYSFHSILILILYSFHSILVPFHSILVPFYTRSILYSFSLDFQHSKSIPFYTHFLSYEINYVSYVLSRVSATQGVSGRIRSTMARSI